MTRENSIGWLFAQATAIVASILLAFLIEAWWSDRQEDEEKDRLLEALKSELSANLEAIENNKKYREAVLAGCNRILTISPDDISADDFDILVADLLWAMKPSMLTGALTSFSAGGKLVLIDDPELTLKISRVDDFLELYEKIMSEDDIRMRNVFLPFLVKKAAFVQLSNATAAGPPGGAKWITGDKIPTQSKRDHRYLLEDEEFRGLVVLKRWDQTDSIGALDYLALVMDDLLATIE